LTPPLVERAGIDFARQAAHLNRRMIRVYGTSVALDGTGILLRGPSGSGKSDLALRLVDLGAGLVADDQTELRRVDEEVWMSAPPAIAGQLEVRGIGILRLPKVDAAPLRLVVDLVSPDAVERLPERRFCTLLDRSLPLLPLAPFEASAPAKLRLALRAFAAPAAMLVAP
jgi:HPr kinase/phosphorylase